MIIKDLSMFGTRVRERQWYSRIALCITSALAAHTICRVVAQPCASYARSPVSVVP